MEEIKTKTKTKTKSKAKKTTAATYSLRVFQVYQLLIKGYDRPEIIQYASEQWGEISDRSVDKYMYDARAMIDQLTSTNATDYLKMEIKRSHHLLSKTLAKGEHGIALEVMRDFRKLMGLYPDEKLRHILDGKVKVEQKADLSTLTEEDLKKIAADLVVKAIETDPGV